MKSLHVGAAALAITALLAGCGGKASFEVTGTITGLKNPGMTLSTSGQDVSPASGATAFRFPKTLSYGDEYDIIVSKQPDHMACSVTTGKGTAGQFSSIAAAVVCTQNAYALGGTVTGMTVAGLELANGGAQRYTFATVPANGDAFTFPQTVDYGSSYGVTVLTQPAGLFCSVANGTGVMGEAAVTSLRVSCVPAT